MKRKEVFILMVLLAFMGTWVQAATIADVGFEDADTASPPFFSSTGGDYTETDTDSNTWSCISVYVNTGTTHSGTYKAGMNSLNDEISVDFNGTSHGVGTVAFYWQASSTTANYTVDLQYKIGSGGTWTTINSYVCTGAGAPTTYQTVSETVNQTGDVWIRWYMSARVGGSFYLDDVTVTDYASAADDPDIGVSNLDFGAILKSTTLDQDLVINNNGASNALNILATNLGGANPEKFSILTSPLPTGIPASGNDKISIRFDPNNQIGAFSASLGIQSNDPTDTWTTVTLSGVGAPPASPLIISQIMFNPSSAEPAWEWIELYNTSGSGVDISGYVIDDSGGTPFVSANIASGVVPANSVAYLYNGDSLTSVQFKSAWGNVTAIPVTGWSSLGLNNTGGDRIGLWDSFAMYDGDNSNHYFTVEDVQYYDSSPWPVDDGFGSFYLTTVVGDNNVGSNWALAIAADIGNTTATGGKVKKSNIANDYASILNLAGATAPIVVDAYTSHTGDLIVVFDQDVEETTAETVGNYELSDGSGTSAFTSAVRDDLDKKTVYLLGPVNTALFDDTTSDVLTVDGVQPDGGGDPAIDATSPRFYAGILSISDIQQTGIYSNAKTTIQGIVCADEEYQQVWIADAAGPWNGIILYDSTGTIDGLVDVGDDIYVVGTVSEYYGLTEFLTNDIHKVVSSGNTPYAATSVTAADLEYGIASDTAPAEQYESVLVKISNANIISGPDGNYEFIVSDDGGTNQTVIDDDAWYHYGGGGSYSPTQDYNITGVVTYSFSHYKICPRSALDWEYIPKSEIENWKWILY